MIMKKTITKKKKNQRRIILNIFKRIIKRRTIQKEYKEYEEVTMKKNVKWNTKKLQEYEEGTLNIKRLSFTGPYLEFTCQRLGH